MLKDLPAGIKFYGQKGLGLTLARSSSNTAEFDTGGAPLVLKAVEGEAMRTTGYSPFICFDVADMDSTIVRLLQLGASLDGPLKYPAYGKLGVVRSPDGHMIGLFEPAAAAADGTSSTGGRGE